MLGALSEKKRMKPFLLNPKLQNPELEQLSDAKIMNLSIMTSVSNGNGSRAYWWGRVLLRACSK